MKTIEDKLHIAHELGRIAGAAECIEDEGTRDTIYGAAESLFDGLLTEAAEEAAEEARRLVRSTCDYPPDPFDFVETGEMVEKEPEPKKQTNFARLTKSPEALAAFMVEDVERCPPDIVFDACPDTTDCVKCWADWLNEEATPDD